MSETETVELDLDAVVKGALLGYSEWLDVNGALRPVKANDPGVRGLRSHPALVTAFLGNKGRQPG